MRMNTIVIGCALMAGFLGGAVSSAFFSAQNVQAQRTNTILSSRGIQIVDEYGNTRIRLGVFSSDIPGVYFYDKSGQTCARFTSREVMFFDKSGSECIVLGLNSWEEKPSLYFKNRDQQTQLALELDTIGHGQPSLFLYDENKNIRLGLGNNSFKDTTSGSYIEQPFSAVMYDTSGKVIWKAP